MDSSQTTRPLQRIRKKKLKKKKTKIEVGTFYKTVLFYFLHIYTYYLLNI